MPISPAAAMCYPLEKFSVPVEPKDVRSDGGTIDRDITSRQADSLTKQGFPWIFLQPLYHKRYFMHAMDYADKLRDTLTERELCFSETLGSGEKEKSALLPESRSYLEEAVKESGLLEQNST